MASNGDDNRLLSEKVAANCSETTVEIKIKTLDSQTYTLRVDKYMPVPELKEQIALVTGVLSEQQRLICRGKVLKDDQLLSAYHVEDGHTLHLVVRQPVAPSSESSPSSAIDPTNTSGRSEGSRGPGVVVGSFNISEQDGNSDLSRVFSALLGSLGLASGGSGSEGIDINDHPLERLSNVPGLAGLRISSRQLPEQANSRGQPVIDAGAFSLPTADPLESLQPPVIPDSLATLSQNLNRLRREFIANVEEQRNSSRAAGIGGRDGQNSDATSFSSLQRGLPTPASLADVMLTTRQILIELAAECLSQLAGQLEGHTNITDASERVRIQSNALRSGILFQNLGAVLLELARTTMTLRIGQTPADAVVNAGPAVFLSPAGPNPIMVQPLPFQLGTGLGATGGTVQPSSGLSTGSGGSGVFPRNIDIRIRTVAVPSSANRRESTVSQNLGETATGASNNGNSAQLGGARGSGSSASGESEVRLVPVRTVIAAVPSPGVRATSDASRGTMGIIYPVIARVQRVTSGSLGSIRGSQVSDQPDAGAVDTGSQSGSDPRVEHQNIRILGVDGSSSSLGDYVDAQGYSDRLVSGVDHLLRTTFGGEQNLDGDGGNPQPQATEENCVAENVDNSEAAAVAAATASNEGTFLSNILRQIIPIIAETGGGSGSSNSSSDANMVEDSSRDVENANRGSSSGREDEHPLQPGSKRQKRD